MSVARGFINMCLLLLAASASGRALEPCAGAKNHFLLVHPDEELPLTGDQDTLLDLAKQTGSALTVIGPDEIASVAKDRYRQSQLQQTLKNLAEVRRRLKTTKKDRELDGLIEMRNRFQEEIQRLQPEREVAIRGLVQSTSKAIQARTPGVKLILVYSGIGARCGKEWCAELASGKRLGEAEWIAMSGASAAILDSGYSARGMDLQASAEGSRLYAFTENETEREEAGKSLIGSALQALLQEGGHGLCLADADHDSHLSFRELANFLSAAFHGKTTSSSESGAADLCLAKLAASCPKTGRTAKYKFDRLFKHPEVLPPVPQQRAPASLDNAQ